MMLYEKMLSNQCCMMLFHVCFLLLNISCYHAQKHMLYTAIMLPGIQDISLMDELIVREAFHSSDAVPKQPDLTEHRNRADNMQGPASMGESGQAPVGATTR